MANKIKVIFKGLYKWIPTLKDNTNIVTRDENTQAHMTSKGGYLGFDESTGSYLRTPPNGLLPNISGVNANIGTSSWRFLNGYFSNLDLSGTVYNSNWYRSTGPVGWYSETYGGGIHMQDSTYVRVYNGKTFLAEKVYTREINSSYHGCYLGVNSISGIGFYSNAGSMYYEYHSSAGKCLRVQAGDDGATNLGYSWARWRTIYCSTGSIQTSDRNKKKDFSKFDERYEKFFLDLKPQRYKFIDGQSGRYHGGYLAQEVEDSLNKVGLTSFDFGGFCKDEAVIVELDEETGQELTKNKVDENGNHVYDYSLRYDEFIPLNTHMIQKLFKTVEQQQKQIDELKEQIELLNIEVIN